MSAASHAPDLPVHKPGRKASWFELFFDLVFVVAVAQLAGSFSHHYDWMGAAVFAFGFLAMWWCWLGHTFHATRFDVGNHSQQWLGLLQIAVVAWMAYGASDLAGARGWVFASGMAVFKLLLAVAYCLCWRWTGARGLIRDYVILYGVQALLWGVSVGLEGWDRWALWGVAFLIDLVSPWWVARHTHQVPPHPEHLPERFGLFTIILLGEGMAATVHALKHGEALTLVALTAAVGGAGLTFLVWLGYFERTRAHHERHVADPHSGRNLRLWAYAHAVLYLGIASLAAGTVFLAGLEHITRAAQSLLAVGVGLVMAALTLLGVAARSQKGIVAWRRSFMHWGVLLAYLAVMLSFPLDSAVYFYVVAAVVFGLQLRLGQSSSAV
jgi:low temperature requirement protein LtrA